MVARRPSVAAHPFRRDDEPRAAQPPAPAVVLRPVTAPYARIPVGERDRALRGHRLASPRLGSSPSGNPVCTARAKSTRSRGPPGLRDPIRAKQSRRQRTSRDRSRESPNVLGQGRVGQRIAPDSPRVSPPPAMSRELGSARLLTMPTDRSFRLTHGWSRPRSVAPDRQRAFARNAQSVSSPGCRGP